MLQLDDSTPAEIQMNSEHVNSTIIETLKKGAETWHTPQPLSLAHNVFCTNLGRRGTRRVIIHTSAAAACYKLQTFIFLYCRAQTNSFYEYSTTPEKPRMPHSMRSGFTGDCCHRAPGARNLALLPTTSTRKRRHLPSPEKGKASRKLHHGITR